MSENHISLAKASGAYDEQALSALFANMVLQQTNMALMLLGQVPHPESGKTTTDLGAAEMFIAQLEMLEAKTKGNLTKQEEALLKQSLTAARMAFVHAVDHPQPSENSKPAEGPAASEPASPQPTVQPPEPPKAGADSTTESESRKKFTKKY